MNLTETRSRGGCPDDATFAALFGSQLDTSIRERVELHAHGCVACKLVVGALRSHRSTASAIDESMSLGGSVEAFVTRLADHARSAVKPGANIGRYIVERPVGAGAMGIVYAAHDPELARRVALKLVRPEIAGGPGELYARVQAEARAMAKLAHPNVVTVHDVGMSDRHVFVAMEFVDGWTLAEWLEDRERGVDEIVALFAAVASGLAAAHHEGLVHRDLKPQNILVGRDGRPRITDFGLATTVSAAAAAEDGSARALVGTPAYMAPEQLRGEGADAASDQFAFCICLYEAVYRQRPYDGAERGKRKPPPPASHVPAAIFQAVSRGLSPERSQRFPSMDALAFALKPAQATSQRRPRRALALAAALAGLAALAATALSAVRGSAPAPPIASGAASSGAPAAPASAMASALAQVSLPETPPPTMAPRVVPAARADATAKDRRVPAPPNVPTERGIVTAPTADDLMGRRY